MAGSLKWFVYTADDATEWALLADESNIESVNGASVAPITNLVKYKLPGNVEPRKATYLSNDGLIRREVVLLNAGAVALQTPGSSYTDQSSGIAVFLKAVDGEKVTLPTLGDTGLLDGDAD
jgi:hypothetical protein